VKFVHKIQAVWRFLKRENLTKMVVIITGMLLTGSIGIASFEPDISLLNGLWWSVVTMTTVGYGDISPVTTGGRVVAALIMFFGIGLLGMLSATLASVLISQRMKENRGMSKFDCKDHFIIVEWNHRARTILHELRADRKTTDAPIILIANLDEKPVEDENLFFVKGVVDEDTLKKAGLARAATVIVLGDDSLEATARDAKVVLSTLSIESIAPDVYTVAELVDEQHVQHCRRAGVDEVIVGSELSSHLIASAAIDHGISRIFSELLSTRYGNDLYSIPLPPGMAGLSFLELIVRMKKEHQSIVLGIQQGHGGALTTNPPADYQVDNGDYLIIISHER